MTHPIRFGYFLNAEYPATADMAVALQEQQQLVRLCADAGYTSVFVGEHFSHGPSIWLPPVPLLVRLASEGLDLDFGTAVLVAPLHQPVALAEEIAFLDHMTQGRFTLGLSAGWNAGEFAALGVDRTQRTRRLEETVEILRLLWGTEGPTSYSGRHFGFEDLELTLRPRQPGGPPIWLGASSARGVQRAASIADSWVISSHLQGSAVGEEATAYGAALRDLGKPQPADRPALRNIFVARTREEALRTAAPFLTESYQTLSSWGLFDEVLGEAPDVDFELAAKRAILGDPDDVAEQLVDFVRLSGTNYVLVRVQWLGMAHRDIAECLALFAEEVVPRVRKALSAS